MRSFLRIVATLAVVFAGLYFLDPTDSQFETFAENGDALASAYRDRRNDLHVTGEGVVIRILPDDRDGDRHQRFILELSSGQTLLIAHNIDRAPRIPSLSTGDLVEFSGEYRWNEQGGLIHWTHSDPNGLHEGGWLRHNGRTYR
jgi:hypothetical protein